MKILEFEDPAKSRIGIEHLSGETIITIPSKRNMFVMLFLTFWLAAWTLGGIAAAANHFVEARLEAKAFILLWLCMWFFGVVFAASSLLWMAFGHERITASLSAVSHSHVIFVQFRRKNYNPQHIENLRVRPINANYSTKHNQNFVDSPSIDFEYGPKTISLGRGMDEGEAKSVIEVIEKATSRSLRK